MRTLKKLKERISIGIDDTSKAQIGLEADKLGLSLAEYVRFILDDRDKILNANATSINPIEQETLERLQTENERLRLLVESTPASILTEEQMEEMNALQSENEALRADMELLRAEDNNIDSETISSLEQDLINANLRTEEVEGELSNLQTRYTEEKESLLLKHKEERQNLIDEVNALTWSEISDEEAELIAQHEKEFNSIVEKLRAEEAESAQKNLIIEELRSEISNYEKIQLDFDDKQDAELVTLSTQISELENELENELADAQLNLSKEESIASELRDKLASIQQESEDFTEYKTTTEQQLSKAITQSEKLNRKLEEQTFENAELSKEVYSQTHSIERLEKMLRDTESRYNQLRLEISEAEKERYSAVAKLERLQDEIEIDKQEIERMEETFAAQKQEAEDFSEKQAEKASTYQTLCSEKEMLISEQKTRIEELQNEIQLLNDQLETVGEEVTEDAVGYFEEYYPTPSATEFNENENQLYSEYITCLSGKHPEEKIEKLILASLDNACQNETAIWVSVPFSKSLKSINKKI